jgi:hypothetical protein
VVLKIPYSKALAALCLVLALAALGVAGVVEHLGIPAVGVALFALWIGATAGSHANAIAGSLDRFINRKVSAVVWGDSIPAGNARVLVLESAFALSAGLHLRLRSETDGRLHHMKVAQPSGVTVDDLRAEIREARYVSWDGRRLRSAGTSKLPALVLEAEGGDKVLR